VAAAQTTFEAGAPDAALELLTAAEMAPLDELQRGRLARLRAEIVFARRRGGDAVPLLLDAANRLERVDYEQAREAYLEAVGAAMFAGRLKGSAAAREVAVAARADCGARNHHDWWTRFWMVWRRGSPMVSACAIIIAVCSGVSR
jgi:outer membrane PBP1 activator LpoA protein